MKLIVGIGNPGNEYEQTRHNVGFIILDSYNSLEKWKNKFNALYIEKKINNEKVIFVKPLTFMNNSGESIIQFVNFYKIASKDILIIHDDLDLPSLSFRIKYSSSSGGHNGIKSIINHLHTQDFLQLKVGIDKNGNDIRDYVLSKLSKDEIDYLNNDIFKNIINDFVIYDKDYLMNKYNGVK